MRKYSALVSVGCVNEHKHKARSVPISKPSSLKKCSLYCSTESTRVTLQQASPPAVSSMLPVRYPTFLCSTENPIMHTIVLDVIFFNAWGVHEWISDFHYEEHSQK